MPTTRSGVLDGADGSSSFSGRMVERQLVDRGICDPRVLAAMRAVPREAFVDWNPADEAYDDRPLPIGAGQTVSQPYMVAYLVEAASIGPWDRVSEIGAGFGYAEKSMRNSLGMQP